MSQVEKLSVLAESQLPPAVGARSGRKNAQEKKEIRINKVQERWCVPKGLRRKRVIPELSVCCRSELTAARACFPTANLG